MSKSDTVSMTFSAAGPVIDLHPVPERPPTRHVTLFGAAIAGVFFLGGGGWAAFAPLHSAAIAPGSLMVETNRQTVQHLEGGIVNALLVRNGDIVVPGQVLVRLDEAQARAAFRLAQGSYDALQALEARLIAERDSLPAIAFPPDLAGRSGDAEVAQMMNGQRTIFAARRNGIDVATRIQRQRIQQLEAEIGSREAQAGAAERQRSLIREENSVASRLYNEGLERKPRVLELRRGDAGLTGTIGEQTSLMASARQKIGEAELEIVGLTTNLMNEVSAELRKTQTDLVEAAQKLAAARDVLERRDLRAPIAGTVVNMRIYTVGGVIQPGMAVLDIVPAEAGLLVEAHLNPNDIDVVHVGQPANISLNAYKQRTMPTLHGTLTYVAADVLNEDKTGKSYYTVRAQIPKDELARLKGVEPRQGMPAQLSIVTGERTALDYLLAPLRESFDRAFRED